MVSSKYTAIGSAGSPFSPDCTAFRGKSSHRGEAVRVGGGGAGRDRAGGGCLRRSYGRGAAGRDLLRQCRHDAALPGRLAGGAAGALAPRRGGAASRASGRAAGGGAGPVGGR